MQLLRILIFLQSLFTGLDRGAPAALPVLLPLILLAPQAVLRVEGNDDAPRARETELRSFSIPRPADSHNAQRAHVHAREGVDSVLPFSRVLV